MAVSQCQQPVTATNLLSLDIWLKRHQAEQGDLAGLQLSAGSHAQALQHAGRRTGTNGVAQLHVLLGCLLLGSLLLRLPLLCRLLWLGLFLHASTILSRACLLHLIASDVVAVATLQPCTVTAECASLHPAHEPIAADGKSVPSRGGTCRWGGFWASGALKARSSSSTDLPCCSWASRRLRASSEKSAPSGLPACSHSR